MNALLLTAALMLAPAAESGAAAVLMPKIAVLDATLSGAQRAALFHAFDDEARIGWSFFPGERAGLVLADLDEAQQGKVLDVLRAGLSAGGFKKAEEIRMLEDVLHVLENNNPGRDKTKYYLAVFGTPDGETPWGLRWEGHHLSLNWTFVDGRIVASTPQFLGSNPARVPSGPHEGFRALGAEEDLARSLLASLDEGQRAQAITGDKAPADILTRMQREAAILADEGVAYADMNTEQRGILMSLIDQLAQVQLPSVAERRLGGLRAAGMDAIKFAWMGGTEKGQGHYFRVQGPTFLIEYDNTQNKANHVHLVWRDFDGDFGRDVLAEHYAAAH